MYSWLCPLFGKKLEDLIISRNTFDGNLSDFPEHLIHISYFVKILDASSNQFTGSLSDEIQNFSFLIMLNISLNQLNGTVRDKLWQLPNLRILCLSYNSLTGAISEGALSNDDVSNLSQIAFQTQFLQSTEPVEETTFSQERIPPSIGYLGQLETLCLYNNTFSGELPLNLKYYTKLSLLDLGANILCGNIPVWIGKNMSRFYSLSLKSNNLFGTIPSQICQLVSLQILDLPFNNLHGTIPHCVNNLTSMVHKGSFLEHNKHHLTCPFDFVDNSYIDHLLIEWQGKVIEFSSILGLLKVIDLSSNNLTGQIPNEVTNLHELFVLDLSNNSLVGEIPRNIGHMIELLTLNLLRNMFSGEMPSSVSDMHSLNDLDVSFNNLSGTVPTSTQLWSFQPKNFNGNVGLCGLPTTKKCLGDEHLGVPHVVKSESDGYSTYETQRWFYVGCDNRDLSNLFQGDCEVAAHQIGIRAIGYREVVLFQPMGNSISDPKEEPIEEEPLEELKEEA
ncbi:leucine-rich repeat-containing protein [Tanacetum coccineum]